jgi:GxxExxY protein
MDEAAKLKRELDGLTERIIGAAIRIHQAVGPGLYESAYSALLAHELAGQEIPFEREKPVPVTYDRQSLKLGYRMDFLVEGCVVIELKAVERLHPVHEAQLLSSLMLSGSPVGLLINFRVRRLVEGIRRMVNGSPD